MSKQTKLASLEIRRARLTKESADFLESALALLESTGNDFFVPTNFSYYGKVSNNPGDFIELAHEDAKVYQVLVGSINMTTALRLMLGRRVADSVDLLME